MNRRVFLGALAAAVAAPALPQVTPAAAVAPLGCVQPGTAVSVTNSLLWLNVGDIVTFGEDPQQFRITDVAESSAGIEPVFERTLLWKRKSEPPWISRRARRRRQR